MGAVPQVIDVRSQWDLAAAMMSGTSEARLTRADGTQVVGRVMMVEHEDGSGNSFNVRVWTGLARVMVYVKLVG